MILLVKQRVGHDCPVDTSDGGSPLRPSSPKPFSLPSIEVRIIWKLRVKDSKADKDQTLMQSRPVVVDFSILCKVEVMMFCV